MNISKRTLHTCSFILIFFSITFLFDYHKIFHYPPSGTHNWRQADCASFAQSYYQNGMDFFNPQVQHTLHGESKTAPSEFPILYYITAAIFHITGHHDAILRIINCLILFVGFFALSRITLGLTKDIFYALAVPLLIMGSPVVAYYAFNYLVNIPALGLSFFGGYCFYEYYVSGNRKWWLACILAFLLAGLLKIPTLIPFIAILFIFFLEQFQLVNFRKEGKIFKNGWWNILAFFSVFATITAWVFWVIQYNEMHQAGVFLVNTNPLWALEEPYITQTWHWIILEGAPQYYHRITRYFIFGTAFLLIFFFRKKLPPILYAFNALIFLGILAIFILLYRQFFGHDYYAVELMVFPAVTFISFFYLLKKSFPEVGNHIVIKLLISTFIIFNLFNARHHIKQKYSPDYVHNENFNYSFYKMKELRQFLADLGIQYPDKALCMEDVSPNLHLYYCNLTGWSGFARDERPFPPSLTQVYISLGAEYLIVSEATYLEHANLIPFLDYPLGVFDHSIFIYDLKPYWK